MKIFISADIEGINGIVNWQETELGEAEHYRSRLEMTKEIEAACKAILEYDKDAYILIKDAHDSARNILLEELNLDSPNVEVMRGWEGNPKVMMAGLDESFDACLFIGYHSAARSCGNSLSHTMDTSIEEVLINNKTASEFIINTYIASYYNVPILFLSGDEALTKTCKELNSNIHTVSTKQGHYGACISKLPKFSHQAIYNEVKLAIKEPLKDKLVPLPDKFSLKIQYKKIYDAYVASFFPGCKLINDDTIEMKSKNYYDLMVAMKFIM